jgi:hypothetical protein
MLIPWYSSPLTITIRQLMAFEDDDIGEFCISVYLESFFIDMLSECLLCIYTDSYTTILIIEYLHLIDM